MAYFAELDIFNDMIAKSSGITVHRQPSENMVGTSTSVSYLFWAPYTFDINGLFIDVDRNVYSPFSKDGDTEKAKSFMLSSGSIGSGLEHAIFEQLYNVSSVSAVKIIQLANEQGIPVYSINSTNVNEILPKLQVSGAVKSGIQSAVASGKVVTIPERNIQYYNWTGIGYIVLDPETGAGAYMISGGIAGGGTSELFTEFIDGLKELFGGLAKIPFLGKLAETAWGEISKAHIRNICNDSRINEDLL